MKPNCAAALVAVAVVAWMGTLSVEGFAPGAHVMRERGGVLGGVSPRRHCLRRTAVMQQGLTVVC